MNNNILITKQDSYFHSLFVVIPKLSVLLVTLIFINTAAIKAQFLSDSYKPKSGKTAAIIQLSTLLDEMVSAETEPCFPEPYYVSKLQTSFDRRSVPGSPTWHANDDWSGFVRYEENNGRTEKVLFDEAGPGVITRIITTGGADSANLRIYFDDEKEASIFIKGYDIAKFPLAVPAGLLYKHEHYPTKQGSSFYYPLPFAKRCKITVDNVKRGYYFHANYRIYTSGTKVKTFQLDEAMSLLEKANITSSKLQNPASFVGPKYNATKIIDSLSTIRLQLPGDSMAIRAIRFKVEGFSKTNYGQLMRSLIVKMFFDGQQTVFAPLSDLSGGGMGAPKVESYYLSADGSGEAIIRFVMPYKKNAEVQITNLSSIAAKVIIDAVVSKWKWVHTTLYFHASWRQENGLETNKGLDYSMASLRGRGVFKGDVLSLYNHSTRWYGEGDEHIWVDGETFPSHFGCGTEDYYNTTFAPIHVYFNPYGGAPREDDEASRGYNSFVRTRNLDVIPFNEKLNFEFELISWDGGEVDYSSTVFWYGDLTSTSTNQSTEEAAAYKLPPPIFTGDLNDVQTK